MKLNRVAREGLTESVLEEGRESGPRIGEGGAKEKALSEVGRN